jgi:hypothetical protein
MRPDSDPLAGYALDTLLRFLVLLGLLALALPLIPLVRFPLSPSGQSILQPHA